MWFRHSLSELVSSIVRNRKLINFCHSLFLCSSKKKVSFFLCNDENFETFVRACALLVRLPALSSTQCRSWQPRHIYTTHGIAFISEFMSTIMRKLFLVNVVKGKRFHFPSTLSFFCSDSMKIIFHFSLLLAVISFTCAVSIFHILSLTKKRAPSRKEEKRENEKYFH